MRVVQAPIKNYRYPGVHKITGVVEDMIGPVHRIVHLYREERGPRAGNLLPVGLYWVDSKYSDPVTGSYEFTHIDGSYTYTLKAFDPDGAWDPVIVAGKIPEPM